MRFHKKRGNIAGTLVMMLLILSGFIVTFNIFASQSQKADEKTPHVLCKASNLAKYGVGEQSIKIGEGLLSLEKEVSLPDGCSTVSYLEDTSIPTKRYRKQQKEEDGVALREATLAQMKDMVRTCWDQFLNGNVQNMFRGSVFKDDPGFICFKFAVSHDVKEKYGTITQQDLARALTQDPFMARDVSDQCRVGGGGLCGKPSSENEGFCDDASYSQDARRHYNFDYLTGLRAFHTTSCEEEEEVCCASRHGEDECLNKGGRCLNEPDTSTGFTRLYSQWNCRSSSRRCFVKNDMIVSISDFIETGSGSDDDEIKGLVLTTGNGGNDKGSYEPLDLTFDEIYAVSVVSPGPDVDWSVVGRIVATGARIQSFFAGLGPHGSVPTVAFSAKATKDIIDNAPPHEVNYILISRYDDVRDKFMEK